MKTQPQTGINKCINIVQYFIIIFFFLSHIPLVQAESIDKPLLFLANQNLAPVAYNKDGKPTGLAIDMVRALEMKMGRPITIICMDWAEAQKLVSGGEADALIQINPTEERKRIYDFSDPLLRSQFSIFTLNNRPGITGASSLRGLRVGVEKGGFPHKVLREDALIHLELIPDFLEGFRMLNNSEIDAVVVDYMVGAYVLADNQIGNIKISGEPVAYSESSIAVSKGNKELLGDINGALSEIRNDGTYSKIISKWEPTDVVFMTREQIEHRNYVIITCVLSLLFMLSLIWVITLYSWIEKRRVAEANLKHKSEELEIFMSTALDLFCIIDSKGKLLMLNEQWEKTLGYSIDELKKHRLVDFIHPGDLTFTNEAVSRLKNGEDLLDFTSRYLCKNGSYRWLEWRAAPSGNLIYAAARDVTDRKRAEEEVLKLNQELERRVADRTARLSAANNELDAFAHMVSHDLRAPLRHIDGFLELLEKRAAANFDAKSRRYLDNVFESTKRMDTLIDNLLSFSRMGRYEMLKRPVDLGALVREVIGEAETTGRNVRWHVGDLPVVMGDLAMLRIVLDNLISNALKFTRPCPRAEIEIGCLPDQWAECVVFIRDNGVGFDMKYVGRLFGVFQRLHGIDEFEGSGIGLANVRRIINRHDGRTWAESALNGGATFYFSLPQPIQGVC